MQTPGYLRAAYPLVFESAIREAATRQLQKLEPERRTYFARVAPGLLYAVMRQESFFYTAALSHAGALGLFQFTPQTFDTLDDKWALLAGGSVSDRAAYLMNERLSIELGTQYFAQRLLPAFNFHLLFAVLAHHSGESRVNKWQALWDQSDWMDDIEMMIESFRMRDFIDEKNENWGIEARGFARNVMRDIAIVEALGLYRDRPER
jgi:soluble lytic murein transglycosylase-like protein